MDIAAEALIVVDVQRAFVVGSTRVPSAEALTSAISRLLALARGAGALVVHLQNDGCVGAVDEPGTDGWELFFTPAPGELVFRKRNDDAFVDTDLDSALRDNHVTVVVICGIQSELCVAATARGAMSRGLSVVLPRAAHGTYPVPPDADGIAVPAPQVRRVAEWSLGDAVLTPRSASHVSFRAVRGR